MAGAGKTSFTRRLAGKVINGSRPYLINLDPACREVPYPANIGMKIITNSFAVNILCLYTLYHS